MADAPTTLINEYLRVVESLTRNDVEFVVCGGIACILHGSTRQTRDIDLAVRLETGNLQRLIIAARELKLQPRLPEPLEHLADERRRKEWMETKNAMVFTLVSLTSPLQVDVFLRYPIGFDQLRADANVMNMGIVSVAVSSKRHLIQAKETVQPPREDDLFDIRLLKELIANEQRRQQHERGN